MKNENGSKVEKMVKTIDASNVYNVIANAKYGKLSDEEKIKVWKITRLLKPIATKLQEDGEDAAKKLKPEGDFDERLQKAQDFENRMRAGQSVEGTMTAQEHEAFVKEFREYQKLVGEAAKEFEDTEVKVVFEKLSEESFCKLMESNDWNFGQATIVGEFICD